MRGKLIYAVLALAALAFLGFLAFGAVAPKASRLFYEWRDMGRNIDFLAEQVYYTNGNFAAPETEDPRENVVVFAGHIYPLNGNSAPEGKRSAVGAEPGIMASFIDYLNRIEATRVIFGGDNLWDGRRAQLLYLKEEIVDRLAPEARFVLGNHDLWHEDKGVLAHPQLFAAVYRAPFFFEDVGATRLIYLRSITDGRIGLGDEQLNFLAEALDGGGFSQALVFLHHPLWIGQSKFGNQRGHYPAAQQALKQCVSTLMKAHLHEQDTARLQLANQCHQSQKPGASFLGSTWLSR